MGKGGLGFGASPHVTHTDIIFIYSHHIFKPRYDKIPSYCSNLLCTKQKYDSHHNSNSTNFYFKRQELISFNLRSIFNVGSGSAK